MAIGFKILRLTKDVNVTNDMKLTKGTEFTIVNDVVYMEGLVVPPGTQNLLYNFIVNNQNLFREDHRRF